MLFIENPESAQRTDVLYQLQINTVKNYDSLSWTLLAEILDPPPSQLFVKIFLLAYW
jgi:hypothetical protein